MSEQVKEEVKAAWIGFLETIESNPQLVLNVVGMERLIHLIHTQTLNRAFFVHNPYEVKQQLEEIAATIH